MLAACGVNAIAINNVNVHATEMRLLTDRLDDVAAIADVLRPYGIRVHLSIGFAAPLAVGGLPTADPLDPRVRDWWARATRRVYEAVPDFGGYLVKADSEGQPGPFGYGRSHADGANVIAEALAPFGGLAALAGLRLQPPSGLAGPVDRPGARRPRPFRPAGRPVP
ncbi:hypothetical protein ACL02O_29690 [Micromonospora sp. MS34]|uniref:hypothetical protein n=1 Tax=Micromonospora sp. MS34 TaxID=3385971 RepID=UPI0039A2794C